jgi:phosphonate transport system ATP-binding protein
MIALHQLDVALGGRPVLRGIDLAVAPGERVALLGPSGAGKTTLFRVLNLGLPPDAGSYRLAGTDSATLRGPARRRARAGIATVHQRHDLVGRLDVLRNILAGRLGAWSLWRSMRQYTWPERADVAAVERILARVGIPEKLHERADRLSGGQQQRAAIARALFQDARLVLADEPVSAVDPGLAEDITGLLCRTCAEDGRTLVASLHQPQLARRFFPRIVGMASGRIAFDLPAAEVDDAQLHELFAGSRGGAETRSGEALRDSAAPREACG